MSDEQWTFTEPQISIDLRKAKERARYHFTLTYFTTNNANIIDLQVTQLDTWEMFVYKHPLCTQTMAYEVMITSAGEFKYTATRGKIYYSQQQIRLELAREYAQLHNFSKAERYRIGLADFLPEYIDVIKIAVADIWIMQFSDNSGYYLEAEIFGTDESWTSKTIFTSQPTQAQVLQALLNEGSGNE